MHASIFIEKFHSEKIVQCSNLIKHFAGLEKGKVIKMPMSQLLWQITVKQDCHLFMQPNSIATCNTDTNQKFIYFWLIS